MTVLLLGNDTAIYTASKNAGSTVRKWVTDSVSRYLLDRYGVGGEVAYEESDYNLVVPRFSRPLSETVLNQTRVNVQQLMEALEELNISYHFGFFEPLEVKYKYSVKRDPVSRFVSCVTQKLGKARFSEINDVQHIIDDFDYFCYQPLREIPPKPDYNKDWKLWQSLIVARHFLPQHLTYGESTDYFSNCFDVSEVNTELLPILQDYFQYDIPQTVTNKGNSPILLSPSQISDVRKIFAKDYEIGYS